MLVLWLGRWRSVVLFFINPVSCPFWKGYLAKDIKTKLVLPERSFNTLLSRLNRERKLGSSLLCSSSYGLVQLASVSRLKPTNKQWLPKGFFFPLVAATFARSLFDVLDKFIVLVLVLIIVIVVLSINRFAQPTNNQDKLQHEKGWRQERAAGVTDNEILKF